MVVPSFIDCGNYAFCETEQWALCDNTNPKPKLQEPVLGHLTARIYGYTHATGGHASSHAEYARVPHAHENCFRVPDELSDEQALFASDTWATRYMGADICDI